MLKTVTLSTLLILLVFSGYPQIEEDYDYQYEFIWGINKNTASGLIGGFTLKYSRAISPRLFETFGLELVNVKHSKEVRYNSRLTGNFFIWGKQNYLYSFRPQYGREMILFRKAPQQGVQISGGVAAGPSIGIIAPYYIQYATGTLGSQVTQQFDPDLHDFPNILGTGRIFQGIEESEIAIGPNAKVGLSFEFGTFKSNVTGFETGFLVDAYTKKIILIPNAKNKAVFPTAFITLFYGSRR